MAYFARLGIDNVVLRVDSVDNRDTMTPGGIEKDELALECLRKVHGDAGTWVRCSYNTVNGVHRLGGTPLRANFPGGNTSDNPFYYNSTHDIFHRAPPTGCASWTLNTTTGEWDPPITKPTLTREEIVANNYYAWDESAYQADNTTGWVLTT